MQDVQHHTLSKEYYLGPLLNEMFLLESSNLWILAVYASASNARVIAPIFVRIAEGKEPFGHGAEIACVILLILSAMVFHTQCILFIAAGIMSFKRKLNMSKLATALLNPNDDD